MKSLKNTILAIFSILLLAVILSAHKSVEKKSNKEFKKVQVDLISMTDKKGVNIPTQG